jgi:hypothetical protein
VIDVEPLIIEKLDGLVPAPGLSGLDWSDVERRAGLGRPRRRLLLTSVALFGLLFLAVGFTRSLGGFGGWLTGEPGKPASTAQQRAFERSIRSWQGFPHGTTLRQLAQTTVGGTTYSLAGFRGAGSLCLRLVALGAQSTNELACLPLLQLRANSAPALVVAADYGVGEARQAPGQPLPIYGITPGALVTLGIVADGVQKVEIAYSNGKKAHAVVAGDSFIAVVDRPSAGDHLTHVWALAGSNRVAVPFVLQPTPFQWPAATAPQLVAHGPSQLQRVIHGGTISWLAHRQPIGVPVPKTVHDIVGTSKTVVYAREITPNPSAPERMVVSILPNHDIRSGHRFGGKYQVCVEVIGGRYRGGGCWPTEQLFSTAPFSESVSTDTGSQYATVAGLLSDDVARMTLYLGNGQTEAVPVHDNGYLIEAPMIDYPLRLVAYDNRGLVIGIVTLQGNTPRPNGAAQPPQPVANAHWHHLITTSAGEVFAAPATDGGTCYEVAYPGGGGGVSCPAKPRPDSVNFGAFGSPKQGLTLELQAGSNIAAVVILYKNGQRQTVTLIDGIALAKIPTGALTNTPFKSIASLTGLDAHGHIVSTQNVVPLIGGSGAIAKLTTSAITIGDTVCRITSGSPALAGYAAGANVQYLCDRGILTLIGRTKPGRNWNARTVLIRGPILRLTAHAITLIDTALAGPAGPASRRTCKITSPSPPTSNYRVGEQVQLYCAGGELTGINRTTPR